MDEIVGYSEDFLRKISRDASTPAAGTGAAGAETQLGDTIPDDMVMHVYEMTIYNPTAATDSVRFFAADAADIDRRFIGRMGAPAGDTIELGKSIKTPILTIRPIVAAGVATQENQLRVNHVTAAQHVRLKYYMLRA